MAKVWHSGERLSEHFIVDEFKCRGKCCADKINVGDGIDPELIAKLEALRTLVNRPIYLTCAYRCPVHNKEEGGVETSLHVRGKAADIYVNDLPVESLAAAAYVIDFSGIGQYPSQGFVHVSVGREGRWIKVGDHYEEFHVDPSLVEYWCNVQNDNNRGDAQNTDEQIQTAPSSQPVEGESKTLVGRLREKLAEFEDFVRNWLDEVEELGRDLPVKFLQKFILPAKRFAEEKLDEAKKYVEEKINEIGKNPALVEQFKEVEKFIDSMIQSLNEFKEEIKRLISIAKELGFWGFGQQPDDSNVDEPDLPETTAQQELPQSQSPSGTNVSNPLTLTMPLEIPNWMKNTLKDYYTNKEPFAAQQRMIPKIDIWFDGKLINPDNVVIEVGPAKRTGGIRVTNFTVYSHPER